MRGKAKYLLSENHRRGISISLALLDKYLSEFEGIALGRESQGEMYKEDNPLSSAQRDAVLREIAGMRELLHELRLALDLEVKTENLARSIWGSSLLLWETLVETEGKYLQRYGEVPPGLAEYLDPRIEELIRRLHQLRNAALDKTDGLA